MGDGKAGGVGGASWEGLILKEWVAVSWGILTDRSRGISLEVTCRVLGGCECLLVRANREACRDRNAWPSVGEDKFSETVPETVQTLELLVQSKLT